MADRIFLVNVGANASHAARSPLFADGTFELLPIPEPRKWWAPPMSTYAKLECFNEPGESLAKYVSDRHRGTRVHYDPEFETFTYGDDCGVNPRGAALHRAEAGDYLLFVARLVRYENGRFTKEAGFYFVGYIRVEETLRDVREFPFGRALTVFGNNAHIRRAIYHQKTALNGFCVFKGSAEGSRRLRHAVPLTRALAEDLLRDARGKPWLWEKNGRSDLQTIGSYTRSVRCALDPAKPEDAERAQRLWVEIRRHDPDVPDHGPVVAPSAAPAP